MKGKKVVVSLLLAAMLFGIIYSVFLILPKKRNNESSSGIENPSQNEGMTQSISSDEVIVIPPAPEEWNSEIKGVWVATVNNIDFPSEKGLTAENLKKEIEAVISTCTKTGINTIYFQVRPSSDAFYKSSIYPTSYFLTGEQGKALQGELDPLAYFIEKAHHAGIKLHAWINPYRVTGNSSITLDMLSKNSPAILHPEWVVKCGEKYYFNPGIPEVRQLVVDGVAEIINNYKVDGIHFDDYFYPDVNFDDQKTFEKYKGSFSNISDWRRENNNLLVKAVYEKVKSIDKSVQFGIAPMGIWANKSTLEKGSATKGGESYSHNFADTYKWVKDKIIDYICPQLYWTDESTASNFSTLLKWWNDATKDSGVQLLIGHALYKLGDKTFPDFKDCSVITNQLKKGRETDNYSGSIFYNYSCIKTDKSGIRTALTEFYREAESKTLNIAFPEDKTTVETDRIWLTGECNPREPLTVNNLPVDTVSINGYFSYTVPLTTGSNSIQVKNGAQNKTITVTRTMPKAVAPGISECFPDDNQLVRYSGGTLELSVITSDNSEVSAVINQNSTVKLSRDEDYGNTKDKTRYKGIFTLPVTEEELNLGKPVFTALSNGKTYTKTAKADILVKPAREIKVGTLKNKAWLRPSSVIQNYKNSLRGFTGFTDSVVGEESIYDKKDLKNSTFVQFKSGFFTQKENVEFSDGTLSNTSISALKLLHTAENTVLSVSSTAKNPVKVQPFENKVIVSIYNATMPDQELKIKNNLLFLNAAINQKEGTVKITLPLKKKDGYFGSSVNYSEKEIKILFKNPSKITDAKKPLTGIKIALDPGHGAKAGASCPDGTNERELNYQFVKRIEKNLKEYGAAVSLSRSEESKGLETNEVPSFYADVTPDLAVSIHHNSVGYASEPLEHSGFEAYYASEQSKSAAELIFQSVSRYAGRRIGSCSNVDYTVSRVREFPSVLLELGYLSNIYEYTWLTNNKNSDLYAKSIAAAIVDYFKWQNEFYSKPKQKQN